MDDEQQRELPSRHEETRLHLAPRGAPVGSNSPSGGWPKPAPPSKTQALIYLRCRKGKRGASTLKPLRRQNRRKRSVKGACR
jgi:hypothetical protein